MKKIDNILWGLVLIFIGVIIGLNSFGITDINLFFPGWWTLFIIVTCFIGLFSNEGKTGNLIGLIIGLVLLLGSNNIISFEVISKLIVPIILVIIGLSLLLKDSLRKSINKEIEKLNKSNKNKDEYCSTFSGQTISFKDEEFKGANLSSIFGGMKCDLKDSIIKKDVVIEATSIFGGIDIIVPDDVNIKIKSTPIFGGVSNKIVNNKDNKITIYINSVCIFGGVEIK